ncbi:MAG: DnaB-like helicase C-terminal domain-containing protein [Flavobacteriaceae bacterium]
MKKTETLKAKIARQLNELIPSLQNVVQQLETIKTAYVKMQCYEDAAHLRAIEKKLQQNFSDLRAFQTKKATAKQSLSEIGSENWIDLLRAVSGSCLVFVGGRPGAGKLHFLLSCMTAHHATVQNGLLLLNQLSTAEVSRYFSHSKSMSVRDTNIFHTSKPEGPPLLVMLENEDYEVDALTATIMKLQETLAVSYVCIESLDTLKIKTGEVVENHYPTICMKLRFLAERTKLPILLLGSLNPELDKCPGHHKRPSVDDLNFYGAIEAYFDSIVLVYRPEYYQLETWEDGSSTANRMEVTIVKSPTGKTACFKKPFEYYIS